MGYYVDAYVPVLAKASIAASQKGVPNEQRVSYSSSASASTGWALNEAPSVGRSAMHIMPPLINRGYYARVAAIRASIKTFLSTLNGTQVVSLGAGFDSTYFVLKDEGFNFSKYIEIDVSDTVLKKATAIRSQRKLFEKHLPNLAFKKSCEITSDSYYLSVCDLRDLAALDAVLMEAGLDKSAPTLFLSECVLIYMAPEESARLIGWAAQNDFVSSYFVLYEQVEPHDQFGQAMLANLKARGCPLLSILEYATVALQEKRFLDLGWDSVQVWNMEKVYNGVVVKNREEKSRVDSLEMMDELEEEILFHRHYCICLASHIRPIPQDDEKAWKLKFEDVTVPLGPASTKKFGGGPFGGARRLNAD